MSCRLLPSPSPPLCYLYLYLSDAQGNWFIFQYGSRSNMSASWRRRVVGQRNLCKHLPGFLTDFWLFSHSLSLIFPLFHFLACAVYLFCCILFFFICRMINSLRNRRMPRKLPHFERFTCFAFRFLLCKQNSALASSASASELEIFYINLAHYKQNSGCTRGRREKKGGRQQESALGHCFVEIRSVSVWLSHAIYLYMVVAALSPD